MSPKTLKFDAPPLLSLAAINEEEALVKMAALLNGHPEVNDSDEFLAAIVARQKVNPPLLGSGVALPHARTSAVREMVCVAGRSTQEILFGPEEIPVRLIFMFGVPPHQISSYLALTASLARRLRSSATIAGLLAADSSDDFLDLLQS